MNEITNLDNNTQGYQDNSLSRALGVGILGASGYQAHKWMLRNNFRGYQRNLYRWASGFEELSPGGPKQGIGRTFGLSERFSSYLIDKVEVPYSELARQGNLTQLGEHFDRLFQGRVNLFNREGLRFSRSSAEDPYLLLEQAGDRVSPISVRFTESGRLGGSSFRYGADIEPRPIHWNWSGEWWRPQRLYSNFQELRHSQAPRGYKSGLYYKDVSGRAMEIQPYLARFGEPLEEDLSNLSSWAGDIFSSTKSRVSRFLFEMAERPQRLLADVGFGLRSGSYNRILHVPFLGEGGLVNNLLLKRVLPAIAIGTGISYLDYLTGHVGSNTLAGLPLKANTIRADITDAVPGARKVTDFYSQIVPGPQYGPLALPVAGAFAGALYHYSKVLKSGKTGNYVGEARELGARFFPVVTGPTSIVGRGAQGHGVNLATTGEGLLARIGKYLSPKNIANVLKVEGHYPGKGLLVGLAAMIPFIPGMLGSRRTGKELRDIYSGREPVAVRSGRWWDMGSTALEGARIKEYRPHWYQLFKSRAEIKSLYGSEEEYWSHNPILHPLRYLKDPYYEERLHFEDRPYPITSPAFSNVPLVGPILAATIGKIVKPPVRMHEDEWSGDQYSLYSTRLEPKGDKALPPPKPVEEFGLGSALKQEWRQFEEFIGLPGFLFYSARSKIFPDDDIGQEVYLQGSRQIDNWSRRYYEKELGAGIGPNPSELGGLFGYSEPLRRFVQRETGLAQANEIPNNMPGWIPGDDYFLNARVGDPYARIAEGYARLPGKGYEALHPEVAGLDPEDYPDLNKLAILGDVFPYSKQYQSLRARLDTATRNDTASRIEYEKIVDRVQKMKESVVRTDERRFSGETDDITGTIARASLGGIELEEYPGRVFRLSSVGMSAADLSAIALGEDNLNKTETAQAVDTKRQQLSDYFQRVFKPGTRIHGVVPRGSAEHSTDIRAVFDVDGRNVNRELIAENLALYRKDMGGAEAGSMYGAFGRALGYLGEELSFTGDESRFNPLRYVPTPGHTKLWQQRTALSQYLEQEVVGTRMRRWDRPIHDFLGPYFRGAVHRTTGENLIPPEVQHRRDLNTLTDVLEFLQDKRLAAQKPDQKGRYTNQARRTAIGANLFSSPIYVASTLPDRDPLYFRKFVYETDPEKRQQILAVVSPEMQRALLATWVGTDVSIAQAEGKGVGPIGEGGRLYDEELVKDYKESGSQLGYGDYVRSREIAEFFDRTGFDLPEEGSEVWDEATDPEDVRLKILQMEGYDRHDFNVFEDRAALLWRKPWLDGAVRDLTHGNSRSVENLRRSVEQILLAAGDRNPTIGASAVPSSKAMANIRVDAEVQMTEDELLRAVRHNPEDFDVD